MMNMLTIMTMMMILMRILDVDTDNDIYIIVYIYKIPTASFKWVPASGTSPGHEPIIDQSCGAVPFFFHVELIEI